MPEPKLWMYRGIVVGATGPRQLLVAFLRSKDRLEIRRAVGSVLERSCLLEIEMQEIEEIDCALPYRGLAAEDALELAEAGDLGYFLLALP